MAETKPYNGPFGLDKLPWWAKTISWLLCMVVLLRIQVDPLYGIMSTSWFPFSFSRHLLEQYSIILGSMSLALVWLRLTGTRWRYCQPPQFRFSRALCENQGGPRTLRRSKSKLARPYI
jgi:hypothetical protein